MSQRTYRLQQQGKYPPNTPRYSPVRGNLEATVRGNHLAQMKIAATLIMIVLAGVISFKTTPPAQAAIGINVRQEHSRITANLWGDADGFWIKRPPLEQMVYMITPQTNVCELRDFDNPKFAIHQGTKTKHGLYFHATRSQIGQRACFKAVPQRGHGWAVARDIEIKAWDPAGPPNQQLTINQDKDVLRPSLSLIDSQGSSRAVSRFDFSSQYIVTTNNRCDENSFLLDATNDDVRNYNYYAYPQIGNRFQAKTTDVNNYVCFKSKVHRHLVSYGETAPYVYQNRRISSWQSPPPKNNQPVTQPTQPKDNPPQNENPVDETPPNNQQPPPKERETEVVILNQNLKAQQNGTNIRATFKVNNVDKTQSPQTTISYKIIPQANQCNAQTFSSSAGQTGYQFTANRAAAGKKACFRAKTSGQDFVYGAVDINPWWSLVSEQKPQPTVTIINQPPRRSQTINQELTLKQNRAVISATLKVNNVDKTQSPQTTISYKIIPQANQCNAQSFSDSTEKTAKQATVTPSDVGQYICFRGRTPGQGFVYQTLTIASWQHLVAANEGLALQTDSNNPSPPANNAQVVINLPEPELITNSEPASVTPNKPIEPANSTPAPAIIQASPAESSPKTAPQPTENTTSTKSGLLADRGDWIQLVSFILIAGFIFAASAMVIIAKDRQRQVSH